MSLAAAYETTERLWWEISARRIVALVAILTVIRFIVAHQAGLLWDEPYYWMWSQHLATGYFDHPPMVAYWVRIGTAILGDGPLGIRLLFILNTVATSIVAYAIGRTLFGERIGWLALLWTNVSPLLGIAGFLATPDGPSVLFWSLTVLALAMATRTERGVWWLAVGLFAGLGAMSKYTNLFLGPGIVLALLIDPRLRRWFLSPWLWAGGIVAALVFLPVILWNADNDWISFRFQFGRIGESAFSPIVFGTLLLVQPLIFNPYAFVFLARGFGVWLRNGAYAREIGILVATSIPAVVFIVFQATHGDVLQHWLAPVFPTLTVVAVAAASAIGSGQWILRRIRTDTVPFALLSALVVFVYATTSLDRFYPGVDPLNSMRGWPAFAQDVEAARVSSGAAWIATAGYENTAELTYELRDEAAVVPVTERQRYAFAPPLDAALLQQPALLVVGSGDDAGVLDCFSEVEDLGDVVRRGAGPRLGSSRIYRVTGIAPDAFTTGCGGQ